MIIATAARFRVFLGGSACAFVAAMTLSFAPLAANGEPFVYRIDSGATQVEYVAHAFGVIDQRGRFADLRGTIVIDREMHTGDVDFEIDARSIDSGWSRRDAFVRSEQMIDAAHHPSIHFHSDRLVFSDGCLARIEGTLTLRGVTRAVVLTITRVACGEASDAPSQDCHAHATATIRRSTFGMESFAPWVADEVDLRFAVVAHRVPDAAAAR